MKYYRILIPVLMLFFCSSVFAENMQVFDDIVCLQVLRRMFKNGSLIAAMSSGMAMCPSGVRGFLRGRVMRLTMVFGG